MPVLLAGILKATARSERLASMPAKATADQLVVRFIDAYDPLIPAVCTFVKLHVGYGSSLTPNRHAS